MPTNKWRNRDDITITHTVPARRARRPADRRIKIPLHWLDWEWDSLQRSANAMSSEEPPEKKARVHFGSFEEQERKRLELGGGGAKENGEISAAVLAGIKAGNINIADGEL